ncbi:unnamed protein product [Brassica napus]|uniref:(rape) hypothetical protein n=1 Tax=Brassica napus TaxID=3708 RepID=A0A817B4C6_BRANA|nr:unnamed protein product [Brassica napus]
MALLRGLLGAKKIINFSVAATSKRTVSVPKGFLAVYVGEDQRPLTKAIYSLRKSKLKWVEDSKLNAESQDLDCFTTWCCEELVVSLDV